MCRDAYQIAPSTGFPVPGAGICFVHKAKCWCIRENFEDWLLPDLLQLASNDHYRNPPYRL